MKSIAVLLTLLSAVLFCCRNNYQSWKQAQNDDYRPDSLLYDCNDFYLYRDAGCIVLTFQKGEYYSPYIKDQLPGIRIATDHKVWIDTCCFDLQRIKDYFGEFANRRMR